jgi:hypothetical protein
MSAARGTAILDKVQKLIGVASGKSAGQVVLRRSISPASAFIGNLTQSL